MPTRPRYPMPDFFREGLDAHGLMKAYQARPPYQQNDYIGWILRAKTGATRERRVNQMLDELREGRVYMKMRWNPK